MSKFDAYTLLTQTNIVATPPTPSIDESKAIGQSKESFQYLLEWSTYQNAQAQNDLDYFEIITPGENSSKTFVSAHDNIARTIISVGVGTDTTITVEAVNKCGERSGQLTKIIKTQNQANLRKNDFVLYLVTSLAVLFCLVSLILLLIILWFAYQKLRKNKVRALYASIADTNIIKY